MDTLVAPLERGFFRMTGPDRVDLLHRLSTGDIARFSAGESATTVLTSEKGRIVDILDLGATDDALFALGRFPTASDAVAQIEKYTIMDDVETTDLTDQISVLGLYGMRSGAIATNVLGVEPVTFGNYLYDEKRNIHVLPGDRLNGPMALHLVVPRNDAATHRDALIEAGASPADDSELTRLRIESGVPSAGRELGLDVNPLEIGLSSLVSFTKGCYVGQEVIARLDSYDKVKRRLVGLKIEGELDASRGDFVVRSRGDRPDRIGTVTSVARRPDGTIVALALVRTMFATAGDVVDVVGDGDANRADATITMLPMNLD